MPAGRVAFSVWGREEFCKFLTIVPKSIEAAGVKLPEKRSNFHLNDKAKLIEMFQKEGFTDILVWN